MISPELLRRYPFFGQLSEAQLKEIAMIAEEEAHDKGAILLQEGGPATSVFFLRDGSVELFYTVEEEYRPELNKEFIIGEVNPGEPFGISALVEPYQLTSSARTSSPSQVIRIDSESLRKLMDEDKDMAVALLNQTTKALMERLNHTRVQLAAAWS